MILGAARESMDVLSTYWSPGLIAEHSLCPRICWSVESLDHEASQTRYQLTGDPTPLYPWHWAIRNTQIGGLLVADQYAHEEILAAEADAIIGEVHRILDCMTHWELRVRAEFYNTADGGVVQRNGFPMVYFHTAGRRKKSIPWSQYKTVYRAVGIPTPEQVIAAIEAVCPKQPQEKR